MFSKLIIILLLILILFIYNLKNFNTIIENNENQNCPTNKSNDPLFLALQNAATLSVIQKQLNNVDKLNKRITNVENQVEINNTAIKNVGKQLENATNEMHSYKP